MSGGIYLIQHDGRLVEMREQAYNSEDLLQKLLADYPNLLAGDQMDSTAPRRWLLISREMAVPGEEGGTGRWSLDHLFLDQTGVPTLVEVKRSSDTRLRREVVGQMLDYAANAVVYWPTEGIRAQFEASRRSQGVDPDQELADFLQDETDGETFWQQVKTNLQAGKVRLVFVADRVPLELRRIVEFLNSQMDPTEVLAVEIKQYVAEDGVLRSLVPQVIGQTARKPGSGRRGNTLWDEQSFFQTLENQCGPADAQVARRIYEWAEQHTLPARWGKGSDLRWGAYSPLFVDRHGKQHKLVTLWSSGGLEVLFEYMQKRPPFSDEVKRRELFHRLNSIPGVVIPTDRLNRRPNFSLAILAKAEALEQFLTTLDWALREIQAV